MSLPLPFVAPVRGVTSYTDAVNDTRVGDLAEIRHEPTNPYDNNACSVSVNGRTIGYLPAELARRLVGREHAWKAVIAEKLTGQAHTGVRVRVLAPLASGGEPDQDRGLGRGPETLREEAAPQLPQSRHSDQSLEKVQEVRARSGRVLGELIGEEDGHVLVNGVNGPVKYPRQLVEITTR